MNTAFFEKYFSGVPARFESGVFIVSFAIATIISIMISVIIIMPPGMA